MVSSALGAIAEGETAFLLRKPALANFVVVAAAPAAPYLVLSLPLRAVISTALVAVILGPLISLARVRFG